VNDPASIGELIGRVLSFGVALAVASAICYVAHLVATWHWSAGVLPLAVYLAWVGYSSESQG
jgi:hypothetical protein